MQKKFHQSLLAFGSMSFIVTSLGFPTNSHADTVNARCDVYPKGEDRAVFSGKCTFSQRQGNVGIQLENGRRYDLRVVSEQSGNYVDQNGQTAYRQAGLGEAGHIYRLAKESIYVYWTGVNNNNQGVNNNNQNVSQANSPTPVTNMTRRNDHQIDAEITEGEFEFNGVLKSSPEQPNSFIGSDGKVRVIYDRSIGQVTIINEKTGYLFYQYNYTDVDEGRL